MTDRRRTFVPVAGLGILAGILAAVASARTWVAGFDASPARSPLLSDVAEAGEMPLASALSLVALACWGVILVTRGAVRRVVALLATLASLGLAVTVVVGYATLPDRVFEALREIATSDTLGTRTTGWFWAAAAATLALVVTTALAFAWCRAWPEMGTRYDAPGSTTPGALGAEEQSNLDLWKSLDEGHDPTA